MYLEEKFKALGKDIERHDRDLEKHDDDIRNLQANVNEINTKTQVSMSEIAASIKFLEKLPDAITQMKDSFQKTNEETQKALISVNNKVDSVTIAVNDLREDIEKTTCDIKKIDEGGKFSIRGWVKDNFTKIIIGVSILVGIVGYKSKDIIDALFK